jgi:hypothetical protein
MHWGGHQDTNQVGGAFLQPNMANEGIPFDSSNFPALSTQPMTQNVTPSRNITGNLQAGAIGQQLPGSVHSRPLGGGVSALSSLSNNGGAQKQADGSTIFGAMGSSYSSSSADTVSKDVRYGLLGLLDVIRRTDKDLNTLALGNDLTTFGLNLNSTECLYTHFW